MVGVFEFQVNALEPRFQLTDSSVTFSITFVCLIGRLKPITTQSTVTDIKHTIRGSTTTYTLPDYTWTPIKCQKKLVYTLSMATGATSLPKFLQSFDFAKREITFGGDRTNFLESNKDWKFKFTAATEDGTVVNSEFTFTV